MNQPLPNPSPEPEASRTAPASSLPRERGWLAAVLPVVLIAACSELGIAVLNNSALPVYFKLGLKIDTRIMGFILVPFFVSEALFKSPLGILADKYGRKPLMLGGAMVTIFTPLLLIGLHYNPAAATAVAVLVGFGFLRLLDGLGQSSLWPALFAYVGDVVEEKKRGAAMGLLNVTYLMGLSFGFLAGGFVDDTFGPILTHNATFPGQMHQMGSRLLRSGRHLREGLRHPHSGSFFSASAPPTHVVAPIYQPEHYFPSFYLASLLFALAAIIAALALRSKTHQAGTTLTPGEPEAKITWQSFAASVRTVPQFLGIAFVTFFGIGCLVFVVKLFVMEEFGLSEQQVGLLILGPALLIACFSVPVGHLADRWGKTRAVRLGFVLAAVGLWGIPWLYHVGHLHDGGADMNRVAFVISASIMGLGSVLAFPAWMALLTSLSSERQRGTVLGAISTAQGVGVLCGSLVGSALYQTHHIAPFVASASFVSVGAICALLFVRENCLYRPDPSEKAPP